MSEEIWKDVIGYEGLYQVSSLGRVMRLAGGQGATPGRILKPGRVSKGYLMVSLYRDGKRTDRYIHRLVAKAFLGDAPPGCEVNHRNGNKTDNRVENLEWVTHAENLNHAHDTLGKEIPRGEAHGNARLIRQQVIEIRKLAATGELSQRELGEMFGVSKRLIWAIVHRKAWQHVP